MPRFFDLVKLKAFPEARQVIDDMMRLVDDSSDRRPFAKVVRRFGHERRGYSYFVEEQYGEASVCYREALNYARSGSRGQLKVRGGLALADFMGSGRDQIHLDALRTELEEVAKASQTDGYPDVLNWARQNLKLIAEGTLNRWVPFEQP